MGQTLAEQIAGEQCRPGLKCLFAGCSVKQCFPKMYLIGTEYRKTTSKKHRKINGNYIKYSFNKFSKSPARTRAG